MNDFKNNAKSGGKSGAGGGKTARERKKENVAEKDVFLAVEDGHAPEEYVEYAPEETAAACGCACVPFGPPAMTPAIAAQIREIAALDPSIRGPEDLLGMECYPRFYELVRRGNSFVDAYRLANFDALAARAAEFGRQAARAAAASKQHLLRTRTRGADAVSVPAEIREGYKAMNPGISDAEIARHYMRYISSLRG